MGGGWVVGGRSSKVILDPTLALIRAQLGFRIQVRAECGNYQTKIAETPNKNPTAHFFSFSAHVPQNLLLRNVEIVFPCNFEHI